MKSYLFTVIDRESNRVVCEATSSLDSIKPHITKELYDYIQIEKVAGRLNAICFSDNKVTCKVITRI